jgi:hypothetical protein
MLSNSKESASRRDGLRRELAATRLDRLRDEEASSIWTGLMRGRPYVLVLPTAITRVRSSTITPYLPIRVLFVLPRPWPPELQGSLRDLEACSCRCC